ncbi:MAG: carboxypeptidase regulatory-like domain-containing protein [Saprospiraceae bacterium]
MRYFTTILLLLSFISLDAQTYLSGKVKDAETGEELIAANLSIFKEDVLITSVTTDFDGNYQLVLDPGTYDAETSYVGYSTSRTKDVVVRAGQNNKLDFELNTGVTLDEIVTTIGCYSISKKNKEVAPEKTKAKSEVAKDIKSTDPVFEGIVPISAGDDLSSKKITTKMADIIDDIGARGWAASAEDISVSEAAGQLTAGEWKDLDHWTFWQKLMKNEVFNQFQNHWNYHSQQRFSVKISDEQGRAAANITVQLLDGRGTVIWETKTDNKGDAELWGNFFGGDATDFKIKIQQDTYVKTFEAIAYQQGINSFSLPLDCSASKEVDVVFVVDVTGSMGDELKYLKAEAQDVIQRAEEELGINLRTGAVCYTDRSESNTVRTSDFNTDEKNTISFLQSQNLGSGGDYPEAVDLGLGYAIDSMNWNEEAISRIVFLMLDAPPHHVESELKSLEHSIKLAAAKGIKVIPIASSGINKETEFLLKFFTMATNGTYTFLTDHSGIGNAHIKPEAGDYNIETLNDMMVRLIGENSTYHDCAPIPDFVTTKAQQNKMTRKERKDKALKAFAKQIKCFPNPAVDHIFVELETAIDLLVIMDSAGRVVQRLPRMGQGQVRVNVDDWAAGVYYFHFFGESGRVVEKMVVTNM